MVRNTYNCTFRVHCRLTGSLRLIGTSPYTLSSSQESEGWQTPPSKKSRRSSTKQTWTEAVMQRAMTMPLPVSNLVKKNRIVPVNKSVKFI